MANENKGIYFTELKLQNVRCFGDEAILKLSNDKGEWQKWNVILGDNGTGKTTLLQCLAGMEQEEFRRQDNNSNEIAWLPKIFNHRENFSLISLNEKESKDAIVIAVISLSIEEFITLDFKEYSKVNKEGPITSTSLIKEKRIEDFFIIGYGANRRISFNIFSQKEITPHNSATLFDDDAKLINAEEWLLQMDYAVKSSIDSKMKEFLEKRRDNILQIQKEILPEITDIKFEPDIITQIPKIQYKTPYGWVGIKQLSFGYKTMVAWIVDVAARMVEKYPKSPNPLHEPVVILVDEIDLHLHPKWQRDIFDFLEKRFPNAQFIVTAHSPLIVQSAPKDANIIVLKKEKVGDEFIVKIINDKNFVRNWRIDQILSCDLFDIGTRNPEVEKLMEERTKLIQKAKLTTKEQERLDELNEVSHSLPTANTKEEIDAMEIIKQAAAFLKNKKIQNDQN